MSWGDSMTLGEKLHKVRMDNGLTQVDFASLFGVTDKAVSTWETGRAFPRFSILQKISKHFHLSIAYLLGEEIIALYDEFDEDKVRDYANLISLNPAVIDMVELLKGATYEEVEELVAFCDNWLAGKRANRSKTLISVKSEIADKYIVDKDD